MFYLEEKLNRYNLIWNLRSSRCSDYRLSYGLEEGFSASDYTFTVSPAITVDQANNLRTAGLTMSTSQTYSITDTLTALNTQAGRHWFSTC